MTATEEPTISLGEYVFLRIIQANPKLKSIFGVPGDYNLNLMEYLYKDSITSQGVKFIGNCNELNAAYCSDGYAKIIDTFSVLITTLGVGELSALNGVSSAFSEFVPVLHIVGSVATYKEKQNDASGDKFQNWHHLVQSKHALDKPDCHVFGKMSEPISICTESLTYEGLYNGENFDKIDNVIRCILRESRPGYLYIPADLPDIEVPATRLEQPFEYKEYDENNLQSKVQLEDLADRILDAIYHSESPSFQCDDLVHKFHAYDSFCRIIDKVKDNKFVKLYSSRIGKYIDETLDNFIGVFPSAEPKVIESFCDQTDLLVIFGYTNFETNGLYGGRDWYKNIKNTIFINPDYVKFNDEIVYLKNPKNNTRSFSMNDLLHQIGDHLDVSHFKSIDNVLEYQTIKPSSLNECKTSRISQDKLFNFVNQNIQPNDIILCEVSSFSFGLPDLTLKQNCRLIYNSYYASIGYALPATLGVCLALRDLKIDRRVMLFEGDGSAQMTVQELSTYLRNDVTRPQIFIMNNEGYTIERAIKGETRSYNDIQLWNWEFAGKLFGDSQCAKHKYLKLSTDAEFDAHFATVGTKSDKLEIYDLMMEKTDYSAGLKFFLSPK